MTAGRVEPPTIRLTPGDAGSTRSAGVEYARALSGVPTDAFLEALVEHGRLIARRAVGAGFDARRAEAAAEEFAAAAEAEWRRIAGGGGRWGRA